MLFTMYSSQSLNMKRIIFTLLLLSVFSFSNAQVCQTLTVNTTSVTCNGGSNGSATVTLTGGVAPYTYSWSPSGGTGSVSSGLSAGVYTVRVTDAGTCVVSATVNVVQPNFFVAVKTQTNIVCYGTSLGSVNYTVIGGTPGYTYTWSPYGGNGPSATGLSVGTFTVFITDANSCLLTETVAITGPSFSLTATTTQTNNTCSFTNGGATAIVSGGTPPYNYTWSPTGGNAATATLVSGIYTVNVLDANLCALSKTVNILQSTQFTLTPSISNITCNGVTNGSITMAVSGGTGPFTYTWSPAVGIGTVAVGLAPGVYTLSATDAIGCVGSRTAAITQPPALSLTATQTSISCNGGTGGATVTLGGGTLPYTYTWFPSGGNASSATGLTIGSYTVNARDANLCAISHTFNFTQPPAYTVTASQSNNLCFGAATASAGIAVSGAVAPYTYTWSPSGGNTATATALAAGNYTVSFKDLNNCVDTRTFNITQPPMLSGSIAGSAANCNNADGSATVSATGGAGGYTYTWSPAGGNTPTASAISAGQYTVTVKDLNNCQLNLITTVASINPTVLLSSSNNLFCPGATATLSANGSNSYTWSPSGTLSSANGSVVTASPGVTTTYTVTGANLYGCTVTNTIQIQLLPTPVPSLNITAANLCIGSTATLNASGALTYTWSPATGLSNTLVSNPTTTLTTPVVYTVITLDTQGCSGTNTISITPLPLPVVTISASALSLCLNQGAMLTANGANSYTWSTGGGINPIQVAPASTEVFSVTGMAANGCVNSGSVQIVVNPLPTVSIVGSTVACQGIPSVITATGATNYNWNTGASTSSLSVTPSINTSYSVTGTDVNGCTGTANFSLAVFQTPTLAVAGRREICKNEKVTLNVTGGSTYTWSTGELANSINFTLQANAVVTVSSGIAGCTPGVATVSITVNPLPVVSASTALSVIKIGKSTQLNASGNTSSFNWQPSEGLSCNTCANPVAQPSVTTMYVVESTNAKGCKNSDTVLVEVEIICGEIFTPSAFSPNNDGNNDTWCVYGNCIETMTCEIYNRWGQKVFTMNAKDQCWDGTINGTPQNAGSFIFQLKTTLVTGETKSIKGNFTLIR